MSLIAICDRCGASEEARDEPEAWNEIHAYVAFGAQKGTGLAADGEEPLVCGRCTVEVLAFARGRGPDEPEPIEAGLRPPAEPGAAGATFRTCGVYLGTEDGERVYCARAANHGGDCHRATDRGIEREATEAS